MFQLGFKINEKFVLLNYRVILFNQRLNTKIAFKVVDKIHCDKIGQVYCVSESGCATFAN
jgi:hypothetical protein